jgi:hypothetical protein
LNVSDLNLGDIRDKPATWLVTWRDDAGETVAPQQLPVYSMCHDDLIAGKIGAISPAPNSRAAMDGRSSSGDHERLHHRSSRSPVPIAAHTYRCSHQMCVTVVILSPIWRIPEYFRSK